MKKKRRPNSTDVQVGIHSGASADRRDVADRSRQPAWRLVPAGPEYEKGANRVGAGRLPQIAAIFNIPISALFEAHAHALPGKGTESAAPVRLIPSKGALKLLGSYAEIENSAIRRCLIQLVDDRQGHAQEQERGPERTRGLTHGSQRAVRMWASKHLALVKPPADESVEAAEYPPLADTLRRLRGGWRPGGHLLADARRVEQWSVTRQARRGRVSVHRRRAPSTACSSFTIATVLALDPEEGWALLFGGRWVRLGEPLSQMPPLEATDVQSCAEDWLLSLSCLKIFICQ